MWIKKISQFSDRYQFSSPANPADVEECERKLGTRFHDSFRELFSETNGILETNAELQLVWTIDEILKENTFYRTDAIQKSIYMPFDNLVFFGGAGNGDLFALTITADLTCRKEVFVWNHEDDSRTWAAPDLLTFFDWWLSGKIKI